MFAQPQLRLIFLSLFISSVLLPMENISVKSTNKKRKENRQEQEAYVDSYSSDDEVYIDNQTHQDNPIVENGSKESLYPQADKAHRQNIPVARQSGASCGYHSMLNSILSIQGIDAHRANEIINVKFTHKNGAWRAFIIKMRKEKLVKNYIEKLLHTYMPLNTKEQKRKLSYDERRALDRIAHAYAQAFVVNETLNILKENPNNLENQLQEIVKRDRTNIEAQEVRTISQCLQMINFTKLAITIAHARELIERASISADGSNLETDLYGDNLNTVEMEALKNLTLQEYGITNNCITIIDNTFLLNTEAYQDILTPAKQQMLGGNGKHVFCIRTTANTAYNQQEVERLSRITNDVNATKKAKDEAKAEQTAINRQLSADAEATHWISVTLDRKNGQSSYLLKDSMGGNYTNHPNVTQLIEALGQPKHNAQADPINVNAHNNLNPTGKSDSKSNTEPSEPKVSTNDSQEHKVHAEPQQAQPKPVQDEFAQEKAFHQRLQEHKLIPEGAQAYYKKITPITSDPTKRDKKPVNVVDQWEIVTVSIEGQRIRPTANGVYTHKDLGISFTIDPAVALNPTQPLNTEVTHQKGCSPIRFTKHNEEKTHVMPRFGSYNALLDAMNNNRLTHCITLKSHVDIPEKKPCAILIACMNQCKKSIKMRGMEIVCIKNTGQTKLFFDLIDHENNPIDDFNTITCKQSKVIVDKTVVRIKKNKMYECDVHGFFDSPETRKNWVPDESNFYKLCPYEGKNKITPLPGFYDNSKKLRESVVWVFGEENNSLYQLYGHQRLKDTNEYIYHNEGSFFVTLPYNELYKECFSNKLIALKYLEQVPQPRIFIQPHILTKPKAENNVWPTGVYEHTQGDNKKPLWQRVGARDSILFLDSEISFDVEFPTQSLTTQENKKYCDAAQRFLGYFKADIHSCNQWIVNGLRQWNKLTQLNVSNLKLEDGLTWVAFFTAMQTMTQLKSLHFENNHPIADLMENKWYTEMADSALVHYRRLAGCLAKLTNLEELNIQGLWLKPHRDLGSGCKYGSIPPCLTGVDFNYLPNGDLHFPYLPNRNYDISTQVATLTGIINHREQEGVRTIINRICALKSLKKLSIDGIPNHGSSGYARKTSGQKAIVPLWIISSPFEYFDGEWQDTALKQLVVDSANQTAQMATLETISVYSPGGNCIDYFSQAFRDRLTQAKKTLNVIPKELQ